MKILPIIIGVIAVVLVLTGLLAQSLNVLSYIGTLLVIVLIVIFARGLSGRPSV